MVQCFRRVRLSITCRLGEVNKKGIAAFGDVKFRIRLASQKSWCMKKTKKLIGHIAMLGFITKENCVT